MDPRAIFIGLAILILLPILWVDEENPLVRLLALVVVAGFVGVMIYLGRLGSL